jgi:hypothetical protein
MIIENLSLSSIDALHVLIILFLVNKWLWCSSFIFLVCENFNNFVSWVSSEISWKNSTSHSTFKRKGILSTHWNPDTQNSKMGQLL